MVPAQRIHPTAAVPQDGGVPQHDGRVPGRGFSESLCIQLLVSPNQLERLGADGDHGGEKLQRMAEIENPIDRGGRGAVGARSYGSRG